MKLAAAAGLGLLLVIVGAYLAAAVGVPASLPAFALGFALLIGLVVVNRSRRHASASVRRAVDFADAALVGSLLLGTLVVGNVLAFRLGAMPVDFTRDRAYELAPATTRTLQALTSPVAFTVFAGDSPLALRQRTRLVQMLELYRATNPGMVKVEEIARYADPLEFEALGKRVPEVSMTPGGGVLVEYGTGTAARRAVVRMGDLFEVQAADPEAGPGRFASAFKGEDAVTSTLIRLAEEEPLGIGFTTGHGEPSVDDIESPLGLGLLRTRLTAYGARVRSLDLAVGAVPPGIEVLFVVAPGSPFEARDAQRLRAFAERGGRLVLLVDGTRRTGLEDWLAQEGIRVGTSAIVDPTYNLGGRSDLPLAMARGGKEAHPLIASLANQALVFPGAVPLEEASDPASGRAPSLIARPVLRTSPDSRLQAAAPTSGDAGRVTPTRGPFTVAMALSRRGTKSQPDEVPAILVLSSPGYASNGLAAVAPSNLDLLVNAVGWLRGRTKLAGIPPKAHTARALTVDANLRARLVLLPTLLALAVILGLGVMVHMARRT